MVYLKHHGVKGMRWGVRRDKATLGERWKSLKRERQWKKVVREIDNLTLDQVSAVGKRIGLENDLKRLSKTPIAKSSDKIDYIRRDKMTDAELSEKVVILNAKNKVLKSANEATKEQRELGEKVVNIGGTVALKYAKTKSLSAKDIFESINNPVKVKDKGVRNLVEEVMSSRQ